MNGPLLDVLSISKAFGRTQALSAASLAVAPGEVVAVTGPSGSGKSTLLMCAAGVLRPEAGHVIYADKSLDEMSEDARCRLRRRQFGLVLQFGQLVPELTAVQNVALPLLLERHGRAAAYTSAQAWLDQLGAGSLATMLPGEMSGGEVQRVAIARALVTGPKIIFADEPTGALDTVSGDEVLDVLLTAARQSLASVVMVTHDNRVAAQADREIVLRDGRHEPAADRS